MNLKSLFKTIKQYSVNYVRPKYAIGRKIIKLTGGQVARGPFKSMRYIHESFGSPLLPKILGTYELELEEIVESLCISQPDLIINVGAAEGYFAVGCAMRCPESRVIAFEAEDTGRALTAKMAALNGMSDRIDLQGLCEPKDLSALLTGQPAWIVMDVEGAEEFLLDPDQVPGLRQCSILVELHDFAVSGIADILRSRFESTHHITEILSRERTMEDFPLRESFSGSFYSEKTIFHSMDDRRAFPGQWFYMRKHGKHG